jgi:PAS domain-containing protein
LWFAPLAIGIALIAWLGPPAALLVAADGVLVGLQAWVMSGADSFAAAVAQVGQGLGEGALTALQAWISWYLYARITRGTGYLGDPRAATVFLVVVPGLVIGIGSFVHVGLAFGLGWTAPGFDGDFGTALTTLWVSRALGVLVVTPLLLVTATPLLVRCRWVRPARWQLPHDRSRAPSWRWTEWVELAVLATGTGLVGLVLAVAYGRGEVTSWHLWGLPLLFIVWASLRHGIRGGSAVAATAAILCQLSNPWAGAGSAWTLPLQGNLLAQCVTALLTGASICWIRINEGRYRQVVGQIPVVLYSARFAPTGAAERDAVAEITFVSPACRLLLGREPEELHGDLGRWLECIHPDDRELLRAAISQLRLTPKPVTYEYRVAWPSRERTEPSPGSAEAPIQAEGPVPAFLRPSVAVPDLGGRWVRDTLVPQLGSDGRLEGWDGVVEDITEQRALAQDLRRTTSMLQALVANLPTGVFFVHAPTGQPILVNTRARQLLGQREELAAGLNQLAHVYRLHRPDGTPYPPEDLPVTRAVRKGITSVRDDIVVHRVDGRRIRLVTWAAPIDLGGQGRWDAAVWVMEDWTALHQEVPQEEPEPVPA